MVAEKTKKMPRGVGKRIIETLKNKENAPEIEEIVDIEPGEKIEPVEDNEKIEEEGVEVAENIKALEKELECEPEVNAAESANPRGSDIDTLLHLISRLPSGVTKQTGALIIRQTMEAMGISMNNVLSNAQSVQEELENNIRDNVNVIEEYRTKIKILEQEIQKFRKKAHELEDIISLFILSEDK